MVPRKTSAGARPKALVLDGHSLAFRAFYALPEDLKTTDGTFTNAVYGFTSMLIKLFQEQRPDLIACCFDMAAPLERTSQFADYKATRTEAPATFSPQLPLIREVLRVMRVPVFELAGHEADDIIAYLARWVCAEGVDVRIVTGDRDFFQIVNIDAHAADGKEQVKLCQTGGVWSVCSQPAVTGDCRQREECKVKGEPNRSLAKRPIPRENTLNRLVGK
jgi:5'-3' exonuclease